MEAANWSHTPRNTLCSMGKPFSLACGLRYTCSELTQRLSFNQEWLSEGVCTYTHHRTWFLLESLAWLFYIVANHKLAGFIPTSFWSDPCIQNYLLMSVMFQEIKGIWVLMSVPLCIGTALGRALSPTPAVSHSVVACFPKASELAL